ncbi:MAG: hypothetical protein IAF94_13240 [Pirellulaceae bacterium]|nr:hypothetical protein [Pirellulaceae bacterium]
MSIKVSCQCGKRFTAPPQLAGKSVNCPTCGSPIVIAAPAARPAPISPTSPRVSPAESADGGIVVACRCGQRFRAPGQLAGQQVPCPVCQQPILVPPGAAVIDPTDPFGPLPASPTPSSDLWNALPQQQTWPPPQPQGGLQQPWSPPQPYASPAWAPPSQEVRPNVALAHQYLANAHRQEVEKSQDMDVWGNGQIYSGILTITIAVIWFFGGLLVGIIFFFPPIMFIGGMIALINGIAQKASR